ncbi:MULTISPECIES: hypothetical protein [unclassified Pseudomonas]|uniref:hypothetical protein n=1 Tax=unclassified Pseudomonas TaxID=196821 RepID=UPI0025DF4A4A|nr:MULTISPECIES: hypothetical protein [unclassified Pseudomonas]
MSVNIANLETLVVFTDQDIRKKFPDVSFPETIETHNVIDLGFAVVEQVEAPSTKPGETLEPGDLRRIDDRVVRDWRVLPPSAEALQAIFEQAVQAELDSSAKAWGYDNLFTAISYADEPAVPRFQADGQAFRRWRSLVWDYAHTELNAVLAGEKPPPDLDTFLAGLPALELPT